MRMLLVAWREFGSVVFTKGFLLGIILPPVMAAVVGGAIFMMRNIEGPRVQGRLVVIDQTSATGALVEKRVLDAFETNKAEREKQAKAIIDKSAATFNLPKESVDQARQQAQAQMAAVMPDGDVSVELAKPDADLEALKAELAKTQIRAKGEGSTDRPLLAVAVIPASAIAADKDGTFGVFDLFVAPKLDMQIQNTMEIGIGAAIVDARIASDTRVAASGLDAKSLRALMLRPNIQPVTMTKDGARSNMGPLQMLVPLGFMMLMMISVMTTGQYLMTTVVEEKSSRVMEVLLSAVSPMQLMTGKIIGHMAVGVLLVGLYGGVGIAALMAFALTHLVTPMTLVWLIGYFIVASVTMAAMMAAIGSAVNELREAQTLMTPVMMLTMMPWMIWFLIQRAPNSTLATSLSFVPIVSPFVMVLRLGGSEPVPQWQHPVALAIGAVTSVFVIWAAAKIFRIGVLMYGKPPNFRTLIKWVRMA